MSNITLQKTPVGMIVSVEEPEAVINFDITKLAEKDGNLTGFLRINVYNGKTYKAYTGNFNFAASRSRTSLSNYIKDLGLPVAVTNWDQIIEAVCQKVIDKYYTPEEPVRITPVEYVAPDFLLYPLLIKGYPTLIYAPGGSGKSLTAMLIALLVKNGLNFDFVKTSEPVEVLYLDWEMDLKEAQRRFSMLAPNFEDINLSFPLYKACTLPFEDELENILQIVSKNSIGFVVIDSAAPALGDDINDNSKVIRFFNAVRKLTAIGVTVLILSHVSKAHKEKEDGAMPIGAIFFENLARLTWELKFISDADTMDIALIARKTNFGRMPSVGFNLTFMDGCAFFKKLSNPDRLASTKEQTQEEVVLSILRAKGLLGASVEEIMKEANISKDVVYVILNKLKRRNLATNKDRGIWMITEGVKE